MKRSSTLKLTIAYDGTPYSGWQSQRGVSLALPTIQDLIEAALKKISGVAIGCHGAGRTDTGVHALGQVAHIIIPEKMLDQQQWHLPLQWQRALNALLPPTIRIMNLELVSDSFHARFCPHQKTYRYLIWHDEVLPPHYHQRAWSLYGPLDLEALKRAASILEGTHDFCSFTTPRAAKERHHTIRTLSNIKIHSDGKLLKIDFQGEGFLYHMVRMMVSAVIRVARGKTPLLTLRQRLQKALPPSPQEGGLAPASGLYLHHIDYQSTSSLP